MKVHGIIIETDKEGKAAAATYGHTKLLQSCARAKIILLTFL